MSSTTFDATAAADDAAMGPTGEFAVEPAKQLAVLTCMDARILPHRLLGLDTGDVHVLRNAGARLTEDVRRSLLLSTQLLGVRHVVVMPHTRCGGGSSDDELAAALRDVGVEGELPALHGSADQVAALRADVEALAGDPQLHPDVTVAGYRYDLDSGRVIPLAELEAELEASA